MPHQTTELSATGIKTANWCFKLDTKIFFNCRNGNL